MANDFRFESMGPRDTRDERGRRTDSEYREEHEESGRRDERGRELDHYEFRDDRRPRRPGSP